MCSSPFFVFPAKRFILVPQPRPTLLRASSLLPVKASTSPLLTQGLKLCPIPRLSIQHPLLSALRLLPPLPTPFPLHLENPLPLRRITATPRPYPTRRTAPPGSVQQLHRRIASAGMKQRIHHRPIVHQRGLKDVQMLKSSISPIPVLEAVKDNLLEKGRETDCTPLTGAKSGTDTTGTGVRSETMTAIVTGTDESTETTTIIVRTGIVCPLTTAPTRTGSPSVAGSGPFTIRGSAIETGALTITTTTTNNDTETTGTVSGGGTATPTVRSLTVARGGSRTVETLGRRRTRATAGRGTITLQKRRLPRPPLCQKHPPSPRVHPREHLSPHLDPLQTERIKITRGLLFL